MDAATATLIGVAITGILALFGTIINNRHQLRQLQDQWQHEEKKAQIESEATKERQTKQMLQDIYASAARSLSEVIVLISQETRSLPYTFSDGFVAKVGEAQKWLSLVVAHYYGEYEDTGFKNFYTSYITFTPSDSGFTANVDHLRRCVIEFAKNDPRLK